MCMPGTKPPPSVRAENALSCCQLSNPSETFKVNFVPSSYFCTLCKLFPSLFPGKGTPKEFSSLKCFPPSIFSLERCAVTTHRVPFFCTTHPCHHKLSQHSHITWDSLFNISSSVHSVKAYVWQAP